MAMFKLLFLNIPLILTYPQHSGERYRTNGPLVIICHECTVEFNDLMHVYEAGFNQNSMSISAINKRKASPFSTEGNTLTFWSSLK